MHRAISICWQSSVSQGSTWGHKRHKAVWRQGYSSRDISMLRLWVYMALSCQVASARFELSPSKRLSIFSSEPSQQTAHTHSTHFMYLLLARYCHSKIRGKSHITLANSIPSAYQVRMQSKMGHNTSIDVIKHRKPVYKQSIVHVNTSKHQAFVFRTH